MKKPGTVVLADIDVLVIAYLADLLERHGYHARIAPPLHAAVRDWIRKYDAELCIIDLVLRDGHDVGMIERLATQSPSTKIVIRTADTSSDVMRSALAAGAAGYVHKSRGPVELLEAIARVADGEIVVEGSFDRTAASRPGEQAEFRRLVAALTPRQRECLQMIVEGKGTFAMAVELGVSTMTVRTHVQAVLTKLGVRSRLEAASLVAKYQLPEMT